MAEDRTWDPQRYGALGDSNDGQSCDIFTRAAQAARADAANLLGGLKPATVIGAGDSQSAFRVATRSRGRTRNCRLRNASSA